MLVESDDAMERGGDDTTDGRRKTGWLDRKVDVDVGGEDGGELGWVWLGEARGKQGLEQGPTRAIEGAREGNSTPTQVRPTDPGLRRGKARGRELRRRSTRGPRRTRLR